MDDDKGSKKLLARSMSRRRFLRSAAAGAASLSLVDLLAACQRSSDTQAGPTGATGFDWSSAASTGSFRWGTWPFYMDTKKVNGETVHPTLENFKAETGVEVDYREVIDDYASFVAKLRPQLEAGQSTGFDLITLGYPRWIPQFIQLDYLTPVDQSALENFNKFAGRAYAKRSWDPGNTYSIPYQAGITGIGYDPELTGREITGLADLFDPAFAGKVGMFNDTEDLPNLTLLSMGVEPSESTPDDWNAAAQKLIKQRDAGIVRQYYGQGYIGDLQRGDLAITMAWAADILISNASGYPNLKFVVPEDGALLWVDALCIPKGAESPRDAMTMIDYLYRPDVAAGLTEWVQGVSPVPAAQDKLIQRGARDVAENPLVFPTDAMYSRLHDYRILTPAEQETWDDTFLAVVQA